MDLKLNATIDLKPADVETILKDALAHQFPNFTVAGVRFEAGIDYGPMDRGGGSPVFSGAKVSLKPKS